MKVGRRSPLIVFDVGLHNHNDLRPRRTVSGAGLSISSSIQNTGVAEIDFMPLPLVEGGAIRSSLKPDFFALTIYDLFFKRLQREIKSIKTAYPDAFVVLGGPGVNMSKDLISLRSFFPEATALFRGAGEKVLPEFIHILSGHPASLPFDRETKEKLSSLHGIYINHLGFEHLDQRPNLLSSSELATLPLNFSLPDLSEDVRRSGTLNLHTSRGCPYRCVFCASDKIHEKPIAWPAEKIIEELKRIRELIKKEVLPPNAKRVVFSDDDFFLNRERAKNFFHLLLKDPALNHFFHFDFQGSVHSFYEGGRIDTKLLHLLARVSCSLAIGTDGFHPAALEYFKKDYSWEKAERLIKEIDRAGIRQIHGFVLIYPTITPRILIDTIAKIQEMMRLKTFNLAHGSVYLNAVEGTPLFDSLADDETKMTKYISPEGAEKFLPKRAGPKDPELFLTLHKALYKKINLTYLSHLITKGTLLNGSNREAVKQRRKVLNFIRKLDPDSSTVTIKKLLHYVLHPWFKYFALDHIRKEFEQKYPAA